MRRRLLHGLRLPVLVAVLACLALAPACGAKENPPIAPAPPNAGVDGSGNALLPTPGARPTQPVETLVPLRDGRLHVRCRGSGASTVVLVSGYGDDTSTWARVEPSASTRARVCTYDRLGEGSSDRPMSEQTFATQARQLRELLDGIGEPGPFVLVGHSVGAPVAVTFSSLYRADVRGLLLLDGTPPGWRALLCQVRPTPTGGGASFATACLQQTYPEQNRERLNGLVAYAEVGGITDLSGLPLRVVTAVNSQYEDAGLGPADVARATEIWLAGQRHWVSLSSTGRLVSVRSGHDIQIDEPGLVLSQIGELVAATPR